MMMKRCNLFLFLFSSLFAFSSINIFSQTTILKWQDGKEGCATLTFDDGSINQFRIAVPLLNERNLHATFFIITGDIPGSNYPPAFIGRPIQKIIDESASIPVNKDNLFERYSALYYLASIKGYPEVKEYSDMYAAVGELFEEGKMETVFSLLDKGFKKLRESGQKYRVEKKLNNDKKNTDSKLTWDILRSLTKSGHEIANHTVSHPYLPLMDNANIQYEIEKCSEDLESHLGVKQIFSIECPYGIDSKRVLDYVYPKFPFVRNGLTDSFIKEILRGDQQEPVSGDKEYVQWQRGPLSKTSIDEMKSWIDKTIKNKVWLVLVFHGVEGIGWEALPKEKLKEYYDYIKANENNLWIAAFQDAYKYIRERMYTKVASNESDGKIVITLKSNLDRKIYNLPVTLRTIVPGEWNSVRIQVNGKSSNLNVKKNEGQFFIQFQAVPDGSKIIISNNS
jgi:peptidoglycan/xylan/chitin deacetylase (PgdA/CDA1 family)